MPRLAGQAEGKLEQPRFPFGIRRKLVDPHAQVCPHARDFVLPDAIDRRREAFVVFRRDTRERAVERLEHSISRAGGDGELRFLQRAEELGLDLMKQAALSERVHALQWLRLFERRQTICRRQEEPVRTRGELLQRRHRIRPRVQPLLFQECPGRIGDSDESVVLRPLLSRTRPAFCHRSLQARVQREHVMRTPLHIVSGQHQPAEHGEVVLEVVYRIGRICRRRPREARL